jgi:predicted tellurium resistance membrane protein TerC
MEWISDPNAWVALLTLTVLEIVLGIDNIVFISILVGKLPHELQARARTIGLSLAMITRILLLLTISIIISLTNPLFSIFELDISVRDLILLGGGLFLIVKATLEIHERLEGEKAHATDKTRKASFASVIVQIILLDIVFSLDSVITAVGMADDIGVMVTAVIIAVIVMLFAAGPISAFVNDHPTVKMLALSFLLLIGVALVAEGVHQHIPKGYIYFAMGFSVFVEMLNLRITRTKEEPVELRPIYVKEEPEVPAAPAGTAGSEA